MIIGLGLGFNSPHNLIKKIINFDKFSKWKKKNKQKILSSKRSMEKNIASTTSCSQLLMKGMFCGIEEVQNPYKLTKN